MKLICEMRVQGVDRLVALTTAPNIDLGAFVKVKPGVGKPFYVWPSIPQPNPTSCDFSNAPIVSSDVSANNAAISAITVAPEDVLTWSEE